LNDKSHTILKYFRFTIFSRLNFLDRGVAAKIYLTKCGNKPE
jgi:hypothetical protein